MAKKVRRLESAGPLFCDAGFLIAYFARQDQYHQRAVKIRRRLGKHNVRLVTIWPVLSEASTLLLYHYGYSTASVFLESLAAFQIEIPLEEEYREAVVLFRRFNRDKNLSFTDILIYVFLTGRFKSIPLLTFDRDFSRMGLTVIDR